MTEEFVEDYQPEELEYQPHRSDDPDVWGLNDVARGRTPLVPTTIYQTSGDSASGVAGLLFPSGEFIPKATSKTGQTLRVQFGGKDDGQHIPKGRVLSPEGTIINAPKPSEGFLETVWHGAVKQPKFQHCDQETGVCELRQEHSKGLLLGAYPTKERQMKPIGGVIAQFGYKSPRQQVNELKKAA